MRQVEDTIFNRFLLFNDVSVQELRDSQIIQREMLQQIKKIKLSVENSGKKSLCNSFYSYISTDMKVFFV